MKVCELEPEKICDDCGECDRCDLDPNKKCDDCCACLDPSEFKTVKIDRIITDDEDYLDDVDDDVDDHVDDCTDDYPDDFEDDPSDY